LNPTLQMGQGKVYRTPSDADKLAYEKELGKRRPRYSGHRTRPVLKLLVRSILFLPVVLIRNWIYRWTRTFPVVILYHHVITDRSHHLGTPTAEFARQIAFLKKFYYVASLEQAMQMLQKGEVPQPTVVLTFDDGYEDNYVNLRAVAKHYNIPVFLFVSTGHISSGAPFSHDIRRNQEGFAPLSWEQVRFLHRLGFSFGCHTRNHFDCGSTDAQVLTEEIEGSKTELRSRASIWSEYFSFPWGMPKNMSEEALRVSKSTFKYVFAAAGGTNVIGSDPQAALLRRIDYPATLWELELALQCVLNFDSWRNIFPYAFEPRPQTLSFAPSKEKSN
jgi:peptidoglycan/xylan/chitin deacetylase (PgdA/CDA1 family)